MPRKCLLVGTLFRATKCLSIGQVILPTINGIGDGEMLGPGGARPAGSWPKGQSLVVHSSHIQSNGIPDKLVLFVRDRANLNCNDPDRYLTIENCRVNFNDQAGLLSSMTHEQLYTNFVLSGLRNMHLMNLQVRLFP